MSQLQGVDRSSLCRILDNPFIQNDTKFKIRSPFAYYETIAQLNHDLASEQQKVPHQQLPTVLDRSKLYTMIEILIT
jgi:hypothetical protein